MESIYGEGYNEFGDNSDLFKDDETTTTVEPINKGNEYDNIFEYNSNEKSSLDLFLESKGFTDSKVKVLDENEEEQELSFSELSTEEQLDILNSLTSVEKQQEVNTALNISSDEQEFLGQLKENNLTLTQFLEAYKENILKENKSTPNYDIDSYSDDELYMLDLKAKFDLTDEEVQSELEKALQNEDLYKKKVTKLRTDYKELEDQQKASAQADFEENQQKQYTEFVNEIVGIASGIEDFHGIELDDSEKNDTLSYLLDLDQSGTSKFYKDINDPNKIYELAWYMKYGQSAFKLLQDTYEAEITRLKKEKDKPSVIRQTTHNKIESINDLN